MKKTVSLVGIIFGMLILISVFPIGGTSSICKNITSQEPQTLGGGWLERWLYRRAHNVTGSSAGAQTNYPVPINVRYDNGFDEGANVYLNGKCKANFGDIQFTDSSGTANLDYWIEQKVDGVFAVFWVEIPYIPEHPDSSMVYIYYGNLNATSESNVSWTMTFYTNFEDGTTQGWSISWITHTAWDGTTDQQVFQGNYCRGAGRTYGSNGAGNGHFYEKFNNMLYLSSGSYWIQGAARFNVKNGFQQPQGIDLMYDGNTIDDVNNPQITWHVLGGNLTINEPRWVQLSMQFHLYTSGLSYGTESYYIDRLLMRKWCTPEPAHGLWGTEEISDDKTPPEIVSVEWIPACPYPFVPAITPRQGEPVVVNANVSEETGGSGLDFVQLSYRADGGEWWNMSMKFNATSSLWTSIIPGQLSNTTVEFFITALDTNENMNTTELFSYEVRYVMAGDLDGNGEVDIYDIVMVANNYGKIYP